MGAIAMSREKDVLEAPIKVILSEVDDDPLRDGLYETPERVAKALRFWTSGKNEDPAEVLKVFADGAEGVSQMVVVKGIRVWSMCEHHLATIFGFAHVAYIPDKRIVGLSKLHRVVDLYARRLQVQERLTNQIAEAIQTVLEPIGVGVVLECRHMCMESRGVRQPGSITTTSALKGAILREPSAKDEFLRLIANHDINRI
jgi:GTP cyclohydrolase IA